MAKRIWTIIVAIFILTIIIPLGSVQVSSNPIAIENWDNSPVPAESNETGIEFTSEYVEYTIDYYNQASVMASYSFMNTGNETKTIRIWLPFTNQPPFDLRINNGYLDIDYTLISPSDLTDYKFCAEFNLTIYPSSTKNITAYYTGMVIHDSGFFSDTFHCNYLSETGKYWNNTLDSAVFVFRINKELYHSGLDGFEVSQEDEYIVATMEFNDWIPDRNISITWNNRTTEHYLCISGLLIGVIGAIAIGFALFRKYNTFNDD